MSLRWKIGLGLAGAIFVALLVLGVLRYLDRVEAAERADARADSALQVARQDSATADSALSVLDSVRARERAIRDSLDARLEAAEEDASDAETRHTAAGDSLSATLDSLAEAVGPDLEPVVRKAQAQLGSLRSAHDRFAEQMRRQVELLGDTNSSLRRELTETRTALDTVAQARDSWREAYRKMESARDRWREAARLRLFGLPPEVTHALAAGIGYGLGKL